MIFFPNRRETGNLSAGWFLPGWQVETQKSSGIQKLSTYPHPLLLTTIILFIKEIDKIVVVGTVDMWITIALLQTSKPLIQPVEPRERGVDNYA